MVLRSPGVSCGGALSRAAAALRRHAVVGLAALFGAVPNLAAAFESDVHLGLTKWLALQAGFSAEQAQAIGFGNQRVDSGDMQFIELLSGYACNAKDSEGAEAVRKAHFPATKSGAAAPAERAVVPGSEAASKPFNDLLKTVTGKETFMLYRLGEALHTIQDAWAHQGVPDVPNPLPGAVECDAMLSWSNPKARGGWHSHRADLTAEWPADAVGAAAATYKALLAYPPIAGQVRAPKPWAQVEPQLDGFVRAATKSGKRAWFGAHGIADVSFLAGISLPDGSEPFTGVWEGRKLPPLKTIESHQHHVAPELLDFFGRFFSRWMSADDLLAVATEFGAAGDPPTTRREPAGAARKGIDKATAELSARLKAWRLRDHGSVAEIAHAPQRLTARQLAALDQLAARPGALVRYDAPAQAFFPILPKTLQASPLVPFLVDARPANDAAPTRAVATVKFRHAPYDAVEVLAEKADGRWAIVTIAATVEP